MLRIETVTEASPELGELQALYRRAFPANERRPLGLMLREGGDFLAFYDGALFCGFAVLLSHGDITHILYIAIQEPLRDKGYGAQALEAIRARYPDSRILADIEVERPDADNNDQRCRRRRFYLRSGYAASPVRYRWQGEDYEILVSGGRLKEEEFWNFWAFFGYKSV